MNPPAFSICDMSLSKTLSTQKTCFSPMHRRLLSYAAPLTIDSAALRRHAVSSTTTGGLPGPATIARFFALSAARATAGPPVTTSRGVPRGVKIAAAGSGGGGAGDGVRVLVPHFGAVARVYSRPPWGPR